MTIGENLLTGLKAIANKGFFDENLLLVEVPAISFPVKV